MRLPGLAAPASPETAKASTERAFANGGALPADSCDFEPPRLLQYSGAESRMLDCSLRMKGDAACE